MIKTTSLKKLLQMLLNIYSVKPTQAALPWSGVVELKN